MKHYLSFIMMKQIVSYLFAALVCAAIMPMCNASEAAENREFIDLISQNEDTHMTPNDLAFLLATHSYDATPMDGYVQVRINGTIYKVVPNGAEPGLADISDIN